MPLDVIYPLFESHHLADRCLQVDVWALRRIEVENGSHGLVAGELGEAVLVQLLSQGHLIQRRVEVEAPLHGYQPRLGLQSVLKF